MEATIIYPHQLFAAHPGVAKGRPIYLIEDPLFFGTDPRWPLTLHGQKLVVHRASMQAYAAELAAAEHVVHVVEAPEGSHTDSVGVLEALFPAAPSTLHLADPEKQHQAPCRDHPARARGDSRRPRTAGVPARAYAG